MAGTPSKRRQVVDQTEVSLAKIGRGKFVLGCVTFLLFIWLLQPIAEVLAGEDTNVNVNIAITFSIAVSIAWAVTGAGYVQQKKRADRLERRNAALTGDVAQNKGTETALKQRVKGLEKDLEGARTDARDLRRGVAGGERGKESG